MILYLDTSALVKLYVDELWTSVTRLWVDAATRVVTARVAYAEARAAFARLARAGTLSPTELRVTTRQLDEEWSTYGVVEVGEAVVRRAGSLAERHALRGYDAIHLAAALDAHPGEGQFAFASFDIPLNRAAVREGLSPTPLPAAVRERAGGAVKRPTTRRRSR